MVAASWPMGLVYAALAVGGAAVFFSAFGRLKLREAIGDTPLSKIGSAAMGKVELSGIGEPMGAALSAPFSGLPCIWHRWIVEEERTTYDSKGNSQQSWEKVASGQSDAPFQISDSSGSVGVNPQGAEIDAPQLYNFTERSFFSKTAAPQGPLAIQFRGGPFARRRFREWRLDERLPLTILGVIHPSKEEGPPMVCLGRYGEPFYISNKSRTELEDAMFWGVMGRLVLGAGLCLAGLSLLAYHFLGWRFS